MELVQLVKDVPQRHTAQQNLKMAYEKIKDRKKGIGK